MSKTMNTGTSEALRRALRIDGIGTAIFGLVLLIGGNWLADPLGMPASWFLPLGFLMLVGGIALGSFSVPNPTPPALGMVAVTGNGVLGVAILALAVTNVLGLSASGLVVAYVAVAWVLPAAALQYVGVRQVRRSPAAA